MKWWEENALLTSSSISPTMTDLRKKKPQAGLKPKLGNQGNIPEDDNARSLSYCC